MRETFAEGLPEPGTVLGMETTTVRRMSTRPAFREHTVQGGEEGDNEHSLQSQAQSAC